MLACDVELLEQELHDRGRVGRAVCVVGDGGGEGGLGVGVEGWLRHDFRWRRCVSTGSLGKEAVFAFS